MELTYIKGDLFKLAPKEAYLVHACNAQGVWGAGIAKTFKDKFPEDYKEYKAACRKREKDPGYSIITKNKIICLITSEDYGHAVSDPDEILVNTQFALENIYVHSKLPENAIVYSNKFNSGLFGVPWQHTEFLLKCFLNRRPDLQWTVVEYD